MPTKTVNLSEEAYTRLESLKREGESFSDVVNRLARDHAIRSLSGVLTQEEAETFEEAAQDVDRRMRDEMNRFEGA